MQCKQMTAGTRRQIQIYILCFTKQHATKHVTYALGDCTNNQRTYSQAAADYRWGELLWIAETYTHQQTH